MRPRKPCPRCKGRGVVRQEVPCPVCGGSRVAPLVDPMEDAE